MPHEVALKTRTFFGDLRTKADGREWFKTVISSRLEKTTQTSQYGDPNVGADRCAP